jgi:hypothetical protein
MRINYPDLNLTLLTRVPKGVMEYHKKLDLTNGRPENVEGEQCQQASQASAIHHVNFQTNVSFFDILLTVYHYVSQ